MSVILDVIFPRNCAGCGTRDPETGGHLCWECLSELNLIQAPLCDKCGAPAFGEIHHRYVCSACASNPPVYDTARAGVHYDGLARELLQAFKYHEAIWLADELTRILYAAYLAHYDGLECDAVACVPLFSTRRRERGFNQAGMLAAGLARLISKPLIRNALKRVRPTGTQTRLTAAERVVNVKGAFRVRWDKWTEARRILLVDDIMTTGATVNECAHALRAAGAAAVYVLTVARG